MNPSAPRTYAALLAFLACSPTLSAQSPAIFFTLSNTQVTANTTPTAADVTTIDAPGSGWDYSAAAPVAGTTWNIIKQPNPKIPTGTGDNTRLGLKTLNSANGITLTSATGEATTATLTSAVNVLTLDSSASRVEPNTGNGGNGVLAPGGLMLDAWRIYNGGEELIHTIGGLPPGQRYFVYFYGSTTSAGQGSRFTLDALNVPAGVTGTFIETRGGNSGNVFVQNGSIISPSTPAAANVAATASDATTWGRLDSVVDAGGKLSFKSTRNPTGVNYSNGFQLMPYPTPVITLQPSPTATATVGDGVNLTVIATGEGTITYQWRKNGAPISNGPSGSGSTYAGVTTASFSLSGASAADEGSYDVVLTNPGGATTSTATALTVTTSAIAPTIASNPVSANAVTGGSVSFSASANGTSPLAFQWRKSLNNTDFSDIPGATSSQLNLSSITTADAGYYHLVVTNSVGSATSASASLTVAPVITTPPVAAIVPVGAAKTISVTATAGAGSPVPITYVWKRDGVVVADGGNYSGATTASLAIGTFATADSGNYTVTASNPAGAATSAPVFIGVASAQTYTLSPAAGATAINPDAPLVVRFPSAPRVGSTGKISVLRTADDSVVETIDLAALPTRTNGSATYRYKNKTIGGSGGNAYNYTPVVIVGNEARISLASTTALAYGASYYVTIEPGAILDSNGASMPPVSGNAAWTFATKPAAPSAIPTQTTFTVAADGSGDFSTLQGALEFIPAGNTTPVRLNLKAGTYDGIVNTGTRHNLTLAGEGSANTIVQALNNDVLNGGTSGRLAFFAKGNDLLFRDLSIVNTTPKGGSQAEALRSDGQRVIFTGTTFRSFQDTLLLGGTSYYQDCLIAGDTDYIWGGGTAMFKNCELLCLNPADLTQARTPADRFGFVFVGCRLTKPAGSSITYGLGRNSDNGNSVYIDSLMDTHITAAGWSSSFSSNSRNWEYNSRKLADPTALVDVSQRVLSRQLTAAEADILRNPANVYGLTTDGTPAGAQGGGWVPVVDPATPPVIVTPPQSRSVAAGQPVTFSVVASGSATFTYQWRKGGSPINGQSGSSLTLASVTFDDAGSYDVVVTSSGGSTPSDAAVLTVLSPVDAWAAGYGLDGTVPGFATADADNDGVANLLEYVLGGNPTVADSGSLAPDVIMTEDTEGKKLVIEYDRATAASGVPVVIESTANFAAWTPLTNGVNAKIEVIPYIGQGINLDANTNTGGNYTGLAAAPGTGTVWNSFLTTTPSLTDVKNSAGEATTTDIAVTSSGFSAWSAASPGSPNPLGLMQDYLFGYTYTVSVSSLKPGAYQLYVYAHGDQDNQTSTVTLAAANGGGTKNTAANGGAFRDAFATGAEGVAYVKFNATVSAAGTLQFTAGNYLNGFQLVELSDPTRETVRVTIPYSGERLFVRLRATDN